MPFKIAGTNLNERHQGERIHLKGTERFSRSSVSLIWRRFLFQWYLRVRACVQKIVDVNFVIALCSESENHVVVVHFHFNLVLVVIALSFNEFKMLPDFRKELISIVKAHLDAEDDAAKNIASLLEAAGVESKKDLQFVEEDLMDLKPIIKRRKLLSAFKTSMYTSFLLLLY